MGPCTGLNFKQLLLREKHIVPKTKNGSFGPLWCLLNLKPKSESKRMYAKAEKRKEKQCEQDASSEPSTHRNTSEQALSYQSPDSP